MVEVMIAMTVLAIGMFAVMDNWARLSSVRGESEDISRVNQVMDALQNRILASLGEDLGKNQSAADGIRLPWSLPSDSAAWAADNTVGLNAQDLIDLKVVGQDAGPGNLENFVIFMEYYRAVPLDPATQPGLLQYGTSSETFRAALADPTVRAGCQLTVDPESGLGGLLALDASNASAIGQFDPVIIRIQAYWGTLLPGATLPIRRMEVLVSRRPYRET
jgi:hypothetical protein